MHDNSVYASTRAAELRAASTSRADACAGLNTTRGRLDCNRLVIAAGIWGAHVLKATGLHLPVIPVQHPYIKTVPLALLPNDSPEAHYPIVRDIDNLVYDRQHGDCLGFG